MTLVVSNPGKRAPTPVPPEPEKNVINKPAVAKPPVPAPQPVIPIPGNNENVVESNACSTVFLCAEPVSDPTTCLIVPGKETTVEVITDNKSLGLFFVGGKDTLISVCEMIYYRYKLLILKESWFFKNLWDNVK